MEKHSVHSECVQSIPFRINLRSERGHAIGKFDLFIWQTVCRFICIACSQWQCTHTQNNAQPGTMMFKTMPKRFIIFSARHRELSMQILTQLMNLSVHAVLSAARDPSPTNRGPVVPGTVLALLLIVLPRFGWAQDNPHAHRSHRTYSLIRLQSIVCRL